MRAATPQFRALLVGYLLTAQRGGEVTRFSPPKYDAVARNLALAQREIGEPIFLHVPDALAEIFNDMHGRHSTRLFLTPSGIPWTVV